MLAYYTFLKSAIPSQPWTLSTGDLTLCVRGAPSWCQDQALSVEMKHRPYFAANY